MNVTVEDLSSVKKVMHLEIPLETVARELDKAYDQLKRTARIKGFRQGKAPRGVLERLYRKEVHADVAGRLIQENLVAAIQDTGLAVVGAPQVDPPELQADAPYRFEATVEVRPEIADIDLEGLTFKKTAYTVSEGEIEAQLSMLQRNLAERKPLIEPRPVTAGDFVVIDYAGFKDGKPYDETAPTEDFTIKIGDGTIHKDFDAALVGAEAGQTLEVTVDFEEGYFNPKLAGRKILFQVTVKEIRVEVLPPIDDDLARKLGPYESLDALTQAIRANLESGYAKRTEQELNEQLFKALIERSAFEVPESLVQQELEGILSEAERSFSYQNMTFEQVGLTREALAGKYRDTAEDQVRRHLILGKVIQQEGLTLPDDALEKGMADMAAAYQQPLEGLKGFYAQNPDRLEAFRHALLEKEAIRVIMDRSDIEAVAPPETDAADGNETPRPDGAAT